MIRNCLFKTMISQREVFARVFYNKQKEEERERDSRETERERVCEAEHCGKRKISLAIKPTIREGIKRDENM